MLLVGYGGSPKLSSAVGRIRRNPKLFSAVAKIRGETQTTF
jgi:hypothetical protein